MPRKYQKVVVVTYARSNDGNHFLVSIRYGAITINGLRYTRSTKNDKHQLKWPVFQLLKGKDSVPYPTIRPMQGFTAHVISCIEAWIESDKSKKCVEVPIDSVECQPIETPAEQSTEPVITKRYRKFVLSPCCHKECKINAYVWVDKHGNYPHRKTDDAIEQPVEYGGEFCKWQCPCGREYYSDQIEMSQELIDAETVTNH